MTLCSPFALLADTATIRMKVEHIACTSCAEKFKTELKSLCKELTIDVQKSEALCQYEPPVTPEQVLARAKKAGLNIKCLDGSDSRNAM